jgi:Tfp pilus assembly protein PilF
MTERERALAKLELLSEHARRAEAEVDDALVAAKDAGATYADLATTLGLNSPQAAQHHYRAAVERIQRRQES